MVCRSALTYGPASRYLPSPDRVDLTLQGVGARTAPRLRQAGCEASAARGSDRQQSPGPSLRFVQILGDSMAPTIWPRDYVLVVDADRYSGEGIYMIAKGDDATAYGVDGCGTKTEPLRIFAHNKLYPPRTLSVADFERIVVGKVAMTCRVQDPDLIRESIV